jgi:hypothetical protein
MNKKTEEILMHDSISESEKLFGNKHYSQFDEFEQAFSIVKLIKDNENKRNHLQAINDTYSGMTWNEFKNLIKEHGFISALEYDLVYNKYGNPKTEEAIIYYHPKKGLIIWAESFSGKTSLNDGKLYGEIQANSKEDEEVIWKWISTGGCIDKEKGIWKTSHDVREGLFSKLQTLESSGKFLSKWTDKDRFLWFVDFNEDDVEGYDYKEITKEKILKCPKELQEIIGTII